MELILSSITTACVNLLVFSFIPFYGGFPAQKRNFFFQMAGLYTAAAEKQMVDTPPFAVVYYFFIPSILLSGFHRKPWNTWKTAVPFP